ncbi:hypothetical protein CPT_Mangalyan_172 [Escherichia phage Mangalyan]|nr:hypothetical protein CPT_Mangalyan_172 [Escherichia phage Mangalyan]
MTIPDCLRKMLTPGPIYVMQFTRIIILCRY